MCLVFSLSNSSRAELRCKYFLKYIGMKKVFELYVKSLITSVTGIVP